MKVLPAVIILASLTGCQALQQRPADRPEPTMIQDALNSTLSSAPGPVSVATEQPTHSTTYIEQYLTPSLEFHTPEEEERFDIAASNVPAQEFFLSLFKNTNANVVVHPEVTGDITFNLTSVTIEEALDAIQDAYGYQYKYTSYGYHVLPFELSTRIFPVNYLNVSRQGGSSISVSGGQISAGASSGSSSGTIGGGEASSSTGSSVGASTVNSSHLSTTTQADFWSDLSTALKTIIGSGNGRSVIVNPQAGITVVRALPNELQEVESYLDSAVGSLQKQVIIEAKILEVRLRDSFQSGISWDTLGQQAAREVSGQLGQSPLTNTESINGIFNLNLNFDDFTGLIQLLETQGDVQVLSSPRISTVNNQKAVIKVGTDEFFVTDVANTSTSTGSTTTNIPQVTLTPFFSGIALDVTPQISDGHEITLHVHPAVTQVQERVKQINVGDQVYELPLAVSNIRETDSVVRAMSGQVIVIGGLLEKSQEDLDSGIPLLGRIPGLGLLFKQKRLFSNKSELVILLRPVVVDQNNDWQQHLYSDENLLGATGNWSKTHYKAKATKTAKAKTKKATPLTSGKMSVTPISVETHTVDMDSLPIAEFVSDESIIDSTYTTLPEPPVLDTRETP